MGQVLEAIRASFSFSVRGAASTAARGAKAKPAVLKKSRRRCSMQPVLSQWTAKFSATSGHPASVLVLMGSIFRGLRLAVRSLMGDKGFTITIVLTIAVCIAANTATFALVNSVLLRPLPVPDAGSILLMANRYPRAGADFGYNSASGDYYDRLRDVHVFSEQALFRTTGRTIEIQGTPQRVTGMMATPSLF